MTGATITLELIDAFLRQLLHADRFDHVEGGIFRPTDQPVLRLGLALQPWAGLNEWAVSHQLDAVFLHRPWRLVATDLPIHVGVIAYHLAFDEQLTLGYNPWLAKELALTEVVPFGAKAGRPIGMLGTTKPTPFANYYDRIVNVFGGIEAVVEGSHGPVHRVAIVGAMTDALVHAAHAAAADVYITGQLRHPAAAAVHTTGLAVIAVGHHRSELWGINQLARLVGAQFPQLSINVA